MAETEAAPEPGTRVATVVTLGAAEKDALSLAADIASGEVAVVIKYPQAPQRDG
jgi:hypothetical protein